MSSDIGFPTRRRLSALQDLTDLVFELGDLERLALNLRKALGGHEERAAHELHELTEVELRNQNALEPSEELPEVLRERVDVTKVRMRDAEAPIAAALNRFADGAVRRAPTEDEELALGIADFDLDVGNVVGDAGDLRGAGFHHALVVVRCVRDVASIEVVFEPADA